MIDTLYNGLVPLANVCVIIVCYCLFVSVIAISIVCTIILFKKLYRVFRENDKGE
jgi:hypothetical protein